MSRRDEDAIAQTKRPKLALDDPTGLFDTQDGSDDDYLPLSQTDNSTPVPPTVRVQSAPNQATLASPLEDVECIPFVASKRSIQDRIYSQIHLEPALVVIVDTPQFQRLRNLKQLGGTVYVYPSASHTRFEHCIGVAHLAGKAVEHLMKQDDNRYQIDERDRLCVKIAGLCHDLGHGPFSHTFEHFVNVMRDERDLPHWEHEDASLKLLDYLLADNNIQLEVYGLKPEVDVPFIKLLIQGIKPDAEWPDNVGRSCTKRFLCDIVANKRNGLDVDKFDYFVRDSQSAMGAPPIVCDVNRIIASTKVCQVGSSLQVCYEEKLALQLLDLFKLRAWLHKFVYQHHTVNVIEEMICDALRLADPYFYMLGTTNGKEIRISDAVDDVTIFSRMGDWILEVIEASHQPELAPARAILRRLRSRQLYYPVHIPTNMTGTLRQLKEAEVKSAILAQLPPDSDVAQCTADLLVHYISIDYGSRDASGQALNPIDRVSFFNPKLQADTAAPLKRTMPALLMPQAFSEKLLYVYSRSDESHAALEGAYKQWRSRLSRTGTHPDTNEASEALLTPIATGNQPSPRRAAQRLQRYNSQTNGKRKGEKFRKFASVA
eukprot:m.71392 g.71392  ORF g.71392 m.71392 type:complete len:602 (-) comp14212_c0_seq2:58-1863(-)